MPSISVVTAVIGSETDPLQPPAYVAPGVSYLCFTDQSPSTIPAPWTVRPIERPARESAVLCARRHKILIHDYCSADFIVWHDAAYQLAVDPAIFAPFLWRADVLVLPHPARSTIEEEAAELIRLQLTRADIVTKQAARYRSKGFRATLLSSTGLLIRRSDPHVRAFERAWWDQLTFWKHPRDQMSFDYSAWQTGVTVYHLDGHYRANPYADWTYTKRRRV